MKRIQERRMAVKGLEVRDEPDGTITLTGYASTFNQPYSMGWYTESVDPGAFRRTLGQQPDVRLLINHGGLPLARTASGTLTLTTDSHGLIPTARLDPADPDVAGLVPKMRRGDVDQMSFGFYVTEDIWENDMTQRTLLACDLDDGDVSVVTYPANPNATAGLRAAGPSAEAVIAALRALEMRATKERRALADEDIVGVLQRALGYFASVDNIVDAAQADLADALGVTNPDKGDDGSGSDEAARAALADLDMRIRRLQLA